MSSKSHVQTHHLRYLTSGTSFSDTITSYRKTSVPLSFYQFSHSTVTFPRILDC